MAAIDYKEKYEQALERAKYYHDRDNIQFLENIFPELAESEDEKTKKEIINYLECQSRDEPSRKDTHNKWISYIEKYALSKDDYGFLRDCARVLKTFGWQSYADRLTGLCPVLGEEAKAMMSTPIIFDESEDERIKKELISFFTERAKYTEDSTFNGLSSKDILAWLEKQGETFTKKDVDDAYIKGICDAKHEFEKQGEQKPVDKVEPKFKVGDKIKLAKEPKYPAREIIAIKNDAYYFDELVHLPLRYQDNWELVEQKPEVDQYSLPVSDNSSLPTFDESIYHPCTDEVCEQKSAWSEEDEARFESCIKVLQTSDGYDTINTKWLKSLKGRVQPNPACGEEDRRMLIGLIDELDAIMNKATPNEISVYSKYINWLKSLRPQSQWKPTEEQMDALNDVISSRDIKYDVLSELWKDLKKLKE